MRKMKDSGIEWIGKIPDDWSIQRFKYVVNSLNKGNGITKDEVFPNGNVECVRYGEIYSKYGALGKRMGSLVLQTNAKC